MIGGDIFMKTSTVNLIRLEPSEGMCLRNISTGEVFNGAIYLAKSLEVSDFEEISAEEYERIVETVSNIE